MDLEQQQAQEHPSIGEALQRKHLYFYDGAWETHNVAQKAKDISELQTEELEVCECSCAHIFQEINHIKFICLLKIAIIDCQVQSLEEVQKIYMPSIKSLEIYENPINRVKSLRKCYFPELESFIISNNLINDGERLTQMSLSTVTNLQINSMSSECLSPSDWLMKMKINDEPRISVASWATYRLQQELVFKYRNLLIKYIKRNKRTIKTYEEGSLVKVQHQGTM